MNELIDRLLDSIRAESIKGMPGHSLHDRDFEANAFERSQREAVTQWQSLATQQRLPRSLIVEFLDHELPLKEQEASASLLRSNSNRIPIVRDADSSRGVPTAFAATGDPDGYGPMSDSGFLNRSGATSFSGLETGAVPPRSDRASRNDHNQTSAFEHSSASDRETILKVDQKIDVQVGIASFDKLLVELQSKLIPTLVAKVQEMIAVSNAELQLQLHRAQNAGTAGEFW